MYNIILSYLLITLTHFIILLTIYIYGIYKLASKDTVTNVF